MAIALSELDFSLASEFLDDDDSSGKSAKEGVREHSERVVRRLLDKRPVHSLFWRCERDARAEISEGIRIACDTAAARHANDTRMAALMACVYLDVAMVLARTHKESATTHEGLWRTWAQITLIMTANPDMLTMVDHLASDGKWPAENLAEMWVKGE